MEVWRILAINSYAFAMSVGFGLFFSLATPFFSTHGVSHFWVAFATASGPASGFLQPFIGFFSDRNTSRWGRRRPYILAGFTFTIFGMILFATCGYIGRLAPDPVTESNISVGLGILALWITMVGINIVQPVGLSLVLDLVHPEQSLLSLSLNTVCAGLALCLANSFGFINFTAAFPSISGNYEVIYYIGIILITITGIPTLVFGKEEQFVPTESASCLGASKELIRGIASPYSFFFTDYMGRDVYRGDPVSPVGSEPRDHYEKGVQAGSLTMAIYGAVTICASLPLSKLSKLIGDKALLLIGAMVGATAYGFTIWSEMHFPVPAIMLGALAGVYNAVMTVIPWSLLSKSVDPKDLALNIGVMSLVQVIAQLISNFIAGTIMERLAHLGYGKVNTGISFSAVYLILCIPVIFLLADPEDPRLPVNDDELKDPLLGSLSSQDSSSSSSSSSGSTGEGLIN